MGLTPDKTAVLEIIGKKDNISKATVLVGLPDDDRNILIRNTAILVRFANNVVPEWQDNSEEFRRLLEHARNSPNASREVIKGSKKITIIFVPFLGGFSVSVTPQ